jgi:hypothetical protein
MRALARFAVTAAVAFGGLSCSDSDGGSVSCPDGTTLQESDGGGHSAETRDDAIRHWLDSEGLEASDEAISAGVVAAEPADDPGVERVAFETSDGIEVVVLLEPLDPGWGVSAASWCEPA